MDQLFEDVWLWELQRDEGVVGGEGGAQGEASLCRGCLRPTGQVASRKLWDSCIATIISEVEITHETIMFFWTVHQSVTYF